MKNSTIRKNLVFAIILFFTVASVVPSIGGTIGVNNTNFGKEDKNVHRCSSPEWKQLIGNESAGFGRDTNMAIRGIEIYNDELYIGTQSLNKSRLLGAPGSDKIMDDGHFLLYEGVSGQLPFIFEEKSLLSVLISKRFEYNNHYFLMLWLSISLNLAMHMRARMSDGCEVWKYNSSIDTWSQLVGDNPEADLPVGFGDTKTIAASVIKKFKDKLYVGTWTSPIKGCEIWRYDGSIWEQVVGKNALIKGGFNDSRNVAAWCIEEFNDYLYVGTMNWGYTDSGGCQIWRTQDGIHWSRVLDRGFRDFLPEAEQNVHNTYAWGAEVFQDHLYIGTFNTNSVFRLQNSGCQLWRTSDGEDWEEVECPGGDGFGEKENYGIRHMVVYNDELYVATATDAYQPNGPNVQGCEIWKYDGENWTEIIGECRSNPDEKDGFGSKLNKYVWSMTVSSDNKLWVGTLNMQIRMIGETTKGCEVWRYNETSWMSIVKDDVGEIENGFGYIYNEGARGMIEYPAGSGNIVVGTFKLVKPYKILEGCEIWVRYG